MSISICLSAQDTDADSILYILTKELDEVVITERRIKPILESESSSQISINIKELESLPKFMGQSDPLRYLQTIAGVQTNNESTSGIYIQGCDDSQTQLTINGAPIYYPNHLLGLFSGFIPSHFESMKLVKSTHDATFINRLGGSVELQTLTKTNEKFTMDGNIGLISSDVTMKIACGPKSDLFLSARGSYINFLYGKYLNIGEVKPIYNFQDVNLTYAIHPTINDDIVISSYWGNDKLSIGYGVSELDGRINWQNSVTSIYWKRILPKGNFRTTLFCSGFNNKISVDREIGVKGFSDIGSLGVKHIQNKKLSDKIDLDFGGNYIYHFITPLWFKSEDLSNNFHDYLTHSHEIEGFTDVKYQVNQIFSYSIGLHGGSFITNDKIFFNIDPRINAHFNINEYHSLNAHIGTYTQNLHRIALVDGGLPINFWMPSSQLFPSERAISSSIGYIGHFYQNYMTVTTEIYYKRLFNMLENSSNIIQLATNNFEYMESIVSGVGNNYGIDMMLQKNKGKVRGYISYSLGWAQRKIAEISETYFPASYERRHNLVIVGNYMINKSWNIGGTFTLASGTPYTAPKYAYILNQQIVAEFGEFNAANLPLTHRLDLSCDYTILKINGYQLGVNLSLYNVYAHKNVQFIRYSNQKFSVIPISLLGTIIPSLSIFFKI